MKNIKFILGLLLVLTVLSCSKISETKEQIKETVPEPFPVQRSVKFSAPQIVEDHMLYKMFDRADEELARIVPVDKKKLIKDGQISIRSKDIVAAKKRIDDLIKKFKSYYDAEEFKNDSKSISYELKLRIPSSGFEDFVSALEGGKDEIISKSIQSRDITEEYVDIEGRLNTKKEFMRRYKELLTKAGTVKDILSIEENIASLQEEIESREGRLRYLGDQVEYSTLDLTIYKLKEYVYRAKESDRFSERAKNSLGKGWASIVDFVIWTIKAWPLLLLIALLFLVVRRILRKRIKAASN